MAPAKPTPISRSRPRPRKTLRELLFHTLPPYTGPYQVGFLEFELPAQHPRAIAPHIKRDGEYALKLDTVLAAVYYPAEVTPPTPPTPPPSSPPPPPPLCGRNVRRRKPPPPMTTPKTTPVTTPTTTHRRVPWLPRPRASTCKGYAKFFNAPHLPVTAYMALTSMFTRLPAYRNARLSGRWPWEVDNREGSKGEWEGKGEKERGRQRSADTLVAEGAVENGGADGEGKGKNGDGDGIRDGRPQFPVVIFSHGLGGSRTLYSSICGELASFGLVVVALEHRDGSGARTFVNKAGKSEDLESQHLDRTQGPPDNEKKASGQKKKAGNKPYYKIDYLVPKDNAQDTSPHNPNGVDKELRGAQIEMRLAEIEEAFRILGLINSGKGDQVRRDNLRKGPNVGASSAGLDGIDWQDWVGRLDLVCVTMMGHSFGGATTVQALRSEKLTWITQGVLLDPWGPATPECREQKAAHKPVLSIGSEAFMYWQENFDCIERICHEVRAAGTLAWMTTIRGSTHLSQTRLCRPLPKLDVMAHEDHRGSRAGHLPHGARGT
ncbi:uncharacterized protein THITE_2113973 [Thermothielavioides terrestris NRRL 8126]|uniref:Putative phospholipase n=1 Tax=Thermothielavioides terrestris (strain ATCC 38088 / NRRL 8126) TaxID=578455 RepID=G2R4T2_THETT|nr:uncharacterized protein THITE_2113973 [Thermothielavioides terrestris NRRL 8126]AEO66122.1 hypothetical protein THITE_2113973 [Thermothielavioides terrestris NRRL 8126]